MPSWDRDDLLGLARGFMECRIFLTAAELSLFDLLEGEALPADEIARRIGADHRALSILLDALAAMGLLVKKNEFYGVEPSAAPLLVTDSPESVLPMVLHSVGLWKNWSELTEIVGADRVSDEDPNAGLRAFIGAMNVGGSVQADRIVSLINPGAAKRLIDVGGASGTYTIAFLRASPGISATLFDRPGVIEMARERLGSVDLIDRVTLVPGDFAVDRLPPGHDLAFVSAIIHQNGPEQNVELMRNVAGSLDKGGRVVIRDVVLSPDRTSPKYGAIFAVNMLTATSAGNSYTFEEIKEFLETTGFTRVRLIHPDTRMDGLVEAFKRA